jgi:predicted nucleic acid-binding protein
MSAVGFDNTMLSILLNPNARVTDDPATKRPVEHALERAQGLLLTLEKARRKIIVPTPAAAELLTAIGPEAQQYINMVQRSRLFEVASFDPKCAHELAILNRGVFKEIDDRNSTHPYQKRKVDRQIIAVCRVYNVTKIHTTDGNLCNLARLCGINPVRIEELPIPDSARQGDMFKLEPHEAIPDPENDNATVA